VDTADVVAGREQHVEVAGRECAALDEIESWLLDL
jgi:hypothetical protein